MKKRILFAFIYLAFFVFVLSQCAHQHKWEDASCFSPKTCIECGETEGTPRGHNWIEASCQEPKHCIECGKTEGEPIEHTWSDGTETEPRVCKICSTMEPLAIPENGQVFIGSDLYKSSELSIISSTERSCYIKLKGSSGIDVFSFFVRAGSSVTVPVPAGHYYVYFSYGDEWYGTEHLFGPETTYAKDDELHDFKNYKWEYTLKPIYDGNFSETPIDEEEFK